MTYAPKNRVNSIKSQTLSAAKDPSAAPGSSAAAQAFRPQCASPVPLHLWRRLPCIIALLLSALAASASSKFSAQQREEIIRALLDEHPYARRALPSGKAGATIEGNKITPSPAELNQLVVGNGAAARPGERVLITAIRFLPNGILFDVNGGPSRRKKWTERIQLGMSAPDSQPGAGADAEPAGSSVLLKVADPTGLTADRIKDLLAPVLDFGSVTPAEAYRNSLPPALAAAIQAHRALVGMDREMVLSALGRPPRRLRESSGSEEYEEWIYGAPPQEVQFIRFVRGKVVRIEEMKVSGEKLLRTEDEVGKLQAASAPQRADGEAKPDSSASAAASAAAQRRTPPTLLRPEENHPNQGQGAEIPLPPSAPQPEPLAK